MRAAVYGIAAAQTQIAILPHQVFTWKPISHQATEKDAAKLSEAVMTAPSVLHQPAWGNSAYYADVSPMCS
jgi:hypothetical protein